jgi:hypothetical protein
MTKSLKKFNGENFLFIYLSKLAIDLSLGLHKKGRPGYRKGLQPSKENIQHFKT